MPIIASSVQGLPVHQARRPDARADDGATPTTAAVCRHLLGEVIDGVVERELPRLAQAAAS